MWPGSFKTEQLSKLTGNDRTCVGVHLSEKEYQGFKSHFGNPAWMMRFMSTIELVKL